MLRKLWGWLWSDPNEVMHTWVETVEGENSVLPLFTRVCTVCGERQEYDYGCGFSSGMWVVEVYGEKASHVA